MSSTIETHPRNSWWNFFGNSMRSDFPVTLNDVEEERLKEQQRKNEKKAEKAAKAKMDQELELEPEQEKTTKQLQLIPEQGVLEEQQITPSTNEKFNNDGSNHTRGDELNPLKKFDLSTVDKTKKPLDTDSRIAHLVNAMPHRKKMKSKMKPKKDEEPRKTKTKTKTKRTGNDDSGRGYAPRLLFH